MVIVTIEPTSPGDEYEYFWENVRTISLRSLEISVEIHMNFGICDIVPL